MKLLKDVIMNIKDEITYAILEGTWLSPIYVAMSADGLVAVELGGQEAAFQARIKQFTRARVTCDQDALSPVLDQLREFLNGERLKFDLPIDWSNLSSFQRAVLHATSEVPPGHIVSYGEIANQIGKPGAARAVGQALSRNPMPLIIPCHRVVAVDGSLRGYGGMGGVKTKRALLKLEGVHLP